MMASEKNNAWIQNQHLSLFQKDAPVVPAAGVKIAPAQLWPPWANCNRRGHQNSLGERVKTFSP